MSRAKATDVSSPISLFPFIGILLATMGALLVVLIAVSRSARDSAAREAVAQQAAAEADGQQESRLEWDKVHQYLARLSEVRGEAEKRLRDDQLRLGHIEDHIRRLQDQVQNLQHTAMELVSLEHEHYDDRKQAEREVERLGQLISSARDAITSLHDENKSKKRSYAIIPYDGPHGTQRRPIYIECRRDEVVLQPEGIQLTPEDFRPPLGAGNPLAAALRAAREYIVRQEGGPTQSVDTEPYPLILVRPEGILAYYRVREAIESWDAAFGYELVDNDWKLEYPASNPMLADIELQAVERSRSRQQMLIAAAPRAYGAQHQSASGDFEDDELTGGDEFGDGGAEGGFGGDGGGSYGNGSGNGSGGSYAVDAAQDDAQGEFLGDGVPQVGRTPAGNSGNHSQGPVGAAGDGLVGVPGAGTGTTGESAEAAAGGNAASGPAGASSSGPMNGGAPQAPQPGTATSIVAGTAADDGAGTRGSVAPLSPSASGASLAEGVGEAGLMAGNRAASNAGRIAAPGSASREGTGEPSEHMPLDMQMNVQQRVPANARGQNWAIKGKTPTSVPIRRTIRVVVDSNRIAIPPESAQSSTTAARGNEIPLDGATAAQIDDFVAAVQNRVHDWGLAGTGMYWRPVLVLDVAPNGQRRADDLIRLLRNSGIEIRDERAATRTPEGDSRATR